MLARIHKSMRDKDKGFTLIELLVVMIIIGILAAIAIPVFLNQRAVARDTAVKADVSNLGKEIATFYVDGTGTLTSIAKNASNQYTITFATPAATVTAGQASDGVVASATPIKYVSSTDWCVSLTHPDGKLKNFKYSGLGGLQPGVCT